MSDMSGMFIGFAIVMLVASFVLRDVTLYAVFWVTLVGAGISVKIDRVLEAIRELEESCATD